MGPIAEVAFTIRIFYSKKALTRLISVDEGTPRPLGSQEIYIQNKNVWSNKHTASTYPFQLTVLAGLSGSGTSVSTTFTLSTSVYELTDRISFQLLILVRSNLTNWP